MTAAVADLKPSAQAVLGLLERVGEAGVSDLEGWRALGQSRIAARVQEIRASGVEITAELETSADGKRYARYRLAQQYAGWPVTAPRECPSCRRSHAAGRTCSWPSETHRTEATSPLASVPCAAAGDAV